MLKMKSYVPLMFFVVCASTLLFLGSCSNPDEGNIVVPTDTLTFEYEARAFLDSAGLDYDSATVSFNGENYLYYYYIIDIIPGLSGTQLNKNILSIFYSEYLLDSSEIINWEGLPGREPVKFARDVNAIFPIGIDLAINDTEDGVGDIGMVEGEKRGFIFPPELGYGELVLGQYESVIPPNSIIHMIVQLDEIESYEENRNEETLAIGQYIIESELNDTSLWEGNDGFVEAPFPGTGIRYKVMDSTTGQMPVPGNLVTIDYERFYLDTTTLSLSSAEFDTVHRETQFSFVLDGAEVIYGLDLAVSLMHINEQALVVLPSEMSYKEGITILPFYITEELIDEKIIPEYTRNTKPYTPQVFKITLRSIQ